MNNPNKPQNATSPGGGAANASAGGNVSEPKQNPESNIAPRIAKAPLRPSQDRSEVRLNLRQAEEGLVRNRKNMVDVFAIGENFVKQFTEAGWSIEWKKHTVYGEADRSYEIALADNGWEPVTTDELPFFMPPEYKGSIIRDGLQLMKRPLYLTEESKREDRRAAQAAIDGNLQKLRGSPDPNFNRDHPNAAPKINKSYDRMPIPEA